MTRRPRATSLRTSSGASCFALGHDAHRVGDDAVAREAHLRVASGAHDHLWDSLRRCEPDQVQRDSLSRRRTCRRHPGHGWKVEEVRGARHAPDAPSESDRGQQGLVARVPRECGEDGRARQARWRRRDLSPSTLARAVREPAPCRPGPARSAQARRGPERCARRHRRATHATAPPERQPPSSAWSGKPCCFRPDVGLVLGGRLVQLEAPVRRAVGARACAALPSRRVAIGLKPRATREVLAKHAHRVDPAHGRRDRQAHRVAQRFLGASPTLLLHRVALAAEALHPDRRDALARAARAAPAARSCGRSRRSS